MKKILFAVLCFAYNAYAQSNCWDLGNGSDGSFHATSNTVLTAGTYHYTTFTIDAGVTVSVTGSVPLEIHCTGAATINGTLTVAGQNGTDGITFSAAGIGGIGVAGGGNGGDGTYSVSVGGMTAANGTYTGFGMGGTGWSGGAGAGFSTAGFGPGVAGVNGGISYGTPDLIVIEGGSGGGGGSGGNNCGSGGGGAGGGALVLYANTISIGATGVITANGGDGGSDGTGNCGGGGAGSGGALLLSTPTLNNDGMIVAEGGSGGASTIGGSPYYGVGGNGADGRIRLDYNNYTGSGLVSPLATLFSVPYSQQALTICSNDSITIGGNSYNTTGIYLDTALASTGCDSIVMLDLTVIPAASNTLNYTLCSGDSVQVGNSFYSSTGVFVDTLSAANTCDSIITTTVTVITIDNTVTQTGGTLTSNQAGADYQWLDCDNSMSAILGAVAVSYMPSTTTGNYAVEVTMGGCSDTSTCYLVDFTGIEEMTLGNKTVVKITDLMGRETPYRPNTPLIFIFDDGTTKRVYDLNQ